MAFCMNISKWIHVTRQLERPFLLKRIDKELRPSEGIAKLIENNIESYDWIPMMKQTRFHRWRYRIQNLPPKLGGLYELFMYHIYRPYLIHSGVKQLLQYTDIYTTRLHGCILPILLNKDCISLFDNSYGKNLSFYETWLTDCESVRIIR